MPKPFMDHATFCMRIKARYPHFKVLEDSVGKQQVQCMCRTHKIKFILRRAALHYQNSYCPECRKQKQRENIQVITPSLKQEDFEKRIYNLFPHYKIIGKYISTSVKIEAKCLRHNHIFMLNPNNALYNKYGQCSECKIENSPSRSSNMAITWIRWVCKQKGWKFTYVRTALSRKGEIKFEEIGYVDGFHAKSNTILEFHGDTWHGNPRKYKTKEVLFFGKTAGAMYKATRLKERQILKAGFKLIVMWEMDWKLLFTESS